MHWCTQCLKHKHWFWHFAFNMVLFKDYLLWLLHISYLHMQMFEMTAHKGYTFKRSSLRIPQVPAVEMSLQLSFNFMFTPRLNGWLNVMVFPPVWRAAVGITVFRGLSHTSLPAHVWQNNLASTASRDCLLIFKEMLLFQNGTEIFLTLSAFFCCWIHGWCYSKGSLGFCLCNKYLKSCT